MRVKNLFIQRMAAFGNRVLAGSDDCRQKQIIKRVSSCCLISLPQSAIKGGWPHLAVRDKFTSSHAILLLLEKQKVASCGGSARKHLRYRIPSGRAQIKVQSADAETLKRFHSANRFFSSTCAR
jgi:hypothetical protein